MRTAGTKIVATIGPASLPVLDELVAAGIDVARINLSHGTAEEHEATATAVRAAAQGARRCVGILVDLPGPKLRLAVLPDVPPPLEPGQRVSLTGPSAAAGHLPIDDPGVLPALRVGDQVLLADGEIELRVAREGRDRVDALVVRGGRPRSRAGVNVPAERLPRVGLDPSDIALLAHVRALSPDWVGQSFVREASDVVALRERLPLDIGIVAKIETRPAVDAIDAILDVADGIMVARGDLGVELPFEEVPLVQKALVAAALAHDRPAIVATQMLESMTVAPRPTRAEASDVANAVLDGADAVMLSAETAIGAWPVLAVEAAVSIAAAADRHAADRGGRQETIDRPGVDPDTRALAVAAVALAESDRDVLAIACATETGRTAEILSALRPPVPIVALAPAAGVGRRLALRHSVVPVVGNVGADVAGIAAAARSAVGHRGMRGLGQRDLIVVVASLSPGDTADLVSIVPA